MRRGRVAGTERVGIFIVTVEHAVETSVGLADLAKSRLEWRGSAGAQSTYGGQWESCVTTIARCSTFVNGRSNFRPRSILAIARGCGQ